MKLTTTIEYTEPQARREAIGILEEEANQLASMSHYEAEYNKLPHRAKIAIQREITRLRAIAVTLKPL